MGGDHGCGVVVQGAKMALDGNSTIQQLYLVGNETDINKAIAEKGLNIELLPVDLGAKEQFSRYYTARYDHAIFKQSLHRNIVFSHHNLVTDGSFNEFHVIICRNCMIYFDEQLQARVHGLFHESLRRFGILALGRKESLAGTPHQHDYEELNAAEKLFRRRGAG